uniref:Uncharacterized protein n=1 Tax=Cannabis sativa TaxID=3483 RepID=A0A803PQH5_CANSA
MRGKSVHLELVQGWLTGKVWELNYGNNKNGSTTNDGDGDGTTTSWTLVHDFEKKRNGFNKSKGFGTSLMGTIPARALYMTVLEVTKSNVGTVTVRLGYSDTTANAAAGLSSAMAIQLVWTLDPN